MAQESISFIYDGGIASVGELHFYEYGRATYAAARLVATIELFRRTGNVPKRITERNYVNITIKAAERGSFPLEILMPLVTEATRVIHEYNIPVDIFLKYVISSVKRLLPEHETTVIELAKLELKKEEQRTAQSHEETLRCREIRKMVESQTVTTNRAIDVLRESLRSSDPRIGEIGATQGVILHILHQLQEKQKLEQEFEPYQPQLEQIEEDKLAKLTAKVRPQLAEIGLPLKRSATSLTIAANKDAFASFDRESLLDLNSRDLDQSISAAELRMFAYDRDTGWGKCDILDLGLTRIPFSVPINSRSKLRRKVLAALDQDAVAASVRYFRDKGKQITSLLLDGISIEPLGD